jgi:hypothetical protein
MKKKFGKKKSLTTKLLLIMWKPINWKKKHGKKNEEEWD